MSLATQVILLTSWVPASGFCLIKPLIWLYERSEVVVGRVESPHKAFLPSCNFCLNFQLNHYFSSWSWVISSALHMNTHTAALHYGAGTEQASNLDFTGACISLRVKMQWAAPLISRCSCKDAQLWVRELPAPSNLTPADLRAKPRPCPQSRCADRASEEWSCIRYVATRKRV